MANSSDDIISVDFARRGKPGTDYYSVRITRRGSNRRQFVGYLVRARADGDDWVAALRVPGTDPMIVRAGTLEEARKLAQGKLLGKLP